jgi:hypothetical protein
MTPEDGENVIQLHKPAIQEDIVRGLRNLADRLEQEGPATCDMPAVTTVCVVLGHSEAKPLPDGDIARTSWSNIYTWGARNDPFTVRGLLMTVLKLGGED